MKRCKGLFSLNNLSCNFGGGTSNALSGFSIVRIPLLAFGMSLDILFYVEFVFVVFTRYYQYLSVFLR